MVPTKFQPDIKFISTTLSCFIFLWFLKILCYNITTAMLWCHLVWLMTSLIIIIIYIIKIYFGYWVSFGEEIKCAT